ncbi:MAG: PAS domain-containing protein, partial [Flavobacteriaceae bacterium]
YWNKEAETVLGRKREEIVGENLWKKYPDAIDSDFYRQYHKALETGEVINFEEYYPTLNKWFEVSAYPSEKGLSVYFKDVTLRKEADIRLLQANERFEKVTEATSDAIWDWDILNDTFYRSQNIQKFFGKSTSTVLSKKDFWLDAFHPDDQEVIKKSLSASLKDPNANRWEAEYRIINESGTIIYIIDRGLIIRDAEGNAIRMIGAMTDITELKQNEEKLKEANKRFEIVTEATNDAIWDYDVVNNKLFWGKGFLTLFGHNPDEITPTFDLLVSLIHEEDRERIVKQVNRYMSDPTLKDWYEEFRFLKADNTIAFVIDRATFIRNSKGKVIRVIGAMNDITDRKNFEQQLLSLNESLDSYAKDLERSNEELESFAFITSHDLQEPLRMITSFMDQLKRKYGEQMDERALQYIHFATDGAKRMKQIILDLLEYSRAGRLIETMEQVDINQLLSDFKQLRRKVISEKSVTITHAELPTIFSSKVTITQVLHSLLDNAIKYSKDGIAPHIELTVTEQKKEWKFSVKDNGIGIEPEFFDKIFIIFQRLHNRDKYDGTGIGLSIAKKNVEFLGGNIWVESTPGKGTTFYFNIPKS